MDEMQRGTRARGPWDAATIRQDLLLYAVTDRTWLDGRSLEQCVEEAISGGATFIQLREKMSAPDEKRTLALHLRDICRKAHTPFLIDDDAELAQEIGADGVHVGQQDLSCAKARKLLGDKAIVGVSAHTVGEAIAAWEAGADYLGVGAMHATATKTDAVPVTTEELARICRTVPIPVVAIGGMNAQTAGELAGTGVAGAAVVSAIFAAKDCRLATQELRRQLASVLAREDR